MELTTSTTGEGSPESCRNLATASGCSSTTAGTAEVHVSVSTMNRKRPESRKKDWIFNGTLSRKQCRKKDVRLDAPKEKQWFPKIQNLSLVGTYFCRNDLKKSSSGDEVSRGCSVSTTRLSLSAIFPLFLLIESGLAENDTQVEQIKNATIRRTSLKGSTPTRSAILVR